MWKWLVSNGIYKDLVAIILATIWTKVIRIGRVLRELSDKLDSTTPGGITDLIKALESAEDDHKKHIEQSDDINMLHRHLKGRK